jgi:pyruvate dehydrogenase E1 component alpha subunit
VIHVRLGRNYGHFEGDAMTYRGPGEIDRLKMEKDCLARFRQRVTEAGLLEAAQMEQIDQEVRQLIDQAVAEAKAARPPSEADLLTDVYVSY